MSYQGRGKQLLGICSGKTEDLERHEMSLFNHGAYNGSPQWVTSTMFEFWTSKEQMEAYFKNRIHHVIRANVGKPEKSARLAARQKFVYLGHRVAGLPNRQVKQIAHAIRPESKACAIAARQSSSFLKSVIVGQRKFNPTIFVDENGHGMGEVSCERPDEQEQFEVAAYASGSAEASVSCVD